MPILNIRRFALAFGTACGVFYIGCVIVMATVPSEIAIRFFNTLTHGVDWTPIVCWDMSLWESLIGTVTIFVLGWLFAALAASIYNLTNHDPPATAENRRL